jgi:hypothetical protein
VRAFAGRRSLGPGVRSVLVRNSMMETASTSKVHTRIDWKTFQIRIKERVK